MFEVINATFCSSERKCIQKQNYCKIFVKCSCQHLEFANGTLGAMLNEFAFEFIRSLKSLLAKTKRRVK